MAVSSEAGSIPKTLHTLQVYRGLAAMFVVCYHATLVLSSKHEFDPFGGFFSWGFSGVHLFFVLSGFIICFIHIRDIGRPSAAMIYARKRFVRIYPVYWVVLAISIPLYLSSINVVNVYHIFDNFTLLRVSNHDKIVSVAWTLSHEILFYLVFLLLILSRAIGVLAILLWSGLVVFRLVTGTVVMPPYFLASLSGVDSVYLSTSFVL